MHDIKLVDAPMFHLVVNNGTNGEVYNMAIRGADEGGLDGVDVSGDNIWIHDVSALLLHYANQTNETKVMITNKDECVTVKSPSKNILIENVYCNSSGGCAIGSLGVNTQISRVHYKKVYTWSSNQMMMIKSNGGSGVVEDVIFEDFIGHGNAYSLDIDQYWENLKPVEGDGVKLSNLTFQSWKGTLADGKARGPVKVACSSKTPCTDVSIVDLTMWTEAGNEQIYTCESGYGRGGCLKELNEDLDRLMAEDGSAAVQGYAATTSVQVAAPTGYMAATMTDDLKTAFGTVSPIPIPTWPSSFYPNTPPISKLAGQ